MSDTVQTPGPELQRQLAEAKRARLPNVLRLYAKDFDRHILPDSGAADALRRAADEIERLRALLPPEE